jgi:hypothetical protein
LNSGNSRNKGKYMKALRVTLALALACVGIVLLLAMDTGNVWVFGDLRYKNAPQGGNGGSIIRNGAMRICQRQTTDGVLLNGTLTTTTGYTITGYGIDGWQNLHSAGYVLIADTVRRYNFATDGSTDTPRLDGYAAPTHYALISNGPTRATQLDTEYQAFGQTIESSEIAPYAGQNVTLSFWAKASQATPVYSVALCNKAYNRSWVAPVTLTQNTWVKITEIITLDSQGYGAGDNGIGAYLYFGLSSGANYATSSTRQSIAGYKFATTGQSQFCSGANTIAITCVKLEPGNYATPYVPATYQAVLARNTRRFYAIDTSNTNPCVGTGFCASTTIARIFVPLPDMASIPTLIYPSASMSGINVKDASNTDKAVSALALTAGLSTTNMAFLSATTSGIVGGNATFLYITTASGNYIWFSSEL